MNELIYCIVDLKRGKEKLKEFDGVGKKGKYTEYWLKNEKVAGIYKNCVFFINAEVEGCRKFVVKLVDKELKRKFRFGTYEVNSEIKLNCDFSEDLFYDFLPALLAEITFIDDYFKKCKEKALEISSFESEVLKYIAKVSIDAVKRGVQELEEIMDELSEYHSQFFSMFASFREEKEKLYESLLRYEALCEELEVNLKSYEDKLRILKQYEEKFKQTLSGLRDLFSLMSLRLDALRNKEYFELQKKTSSLQMAAIAIEFVAVFYYTMKIWEHFSPKKLPLSIEFFLLFLFTTLVVTLTDTIGEFLRTERVSVKGVLVVVSLILTVAFMVYLSIS